MKIKTKKVMLGTLSAIAAVSMPTIAIVACGKTQDSKEASKPEKPTFDKKQISRKIGGMFRNPSQVLRIEVPTGITGVKPKEIIAATFDPEHEEMQQGDIKKVFDIMKPEEKKKIPWAFKELNVNKAIITSSNVIEEYEKYVNHIVDFVKGVASIMEYVIVVGGQEKHITLGSIQTRSELESYLNKRIETAVFKFEKYAPAYKKLLKTLEDKGLKQGDKKAAAIESKWEKENANLLKEIKKNKDDRIAQWMIFKNDFIK
ncbi:hypothetical protein [Mycoplasma todarodis]|uniref:hypothetical protein n=1 Tax=Mycoplasma todarodis TaxID=1937191 RepID=UPI003B33E916